MKCFTRPCKSLLTITVAALPLGLITTILVGTMAPILAHAKQTYVETKSGKASSLTLHKTIKVDGLDIFYREAGPKEAPTILSLHGFPTSSHMFRDLIPLLSNRFHLVAPDYPGYGNSSMPLVDKFDYSFDHLATIIDHLTEKVGWPSPLVPTTAFRRDGTAI